VAAFIAEPVMGRAGAVRPEPISKRSARRRRHRRLQIADEVICGSPARNHVRCRRSGLRRMGFGRQGADLRVCPMAQ